MGEQNTEAVMERTGNSLTLASWKNAYHLGCAFHRGMLGLKKLLPRAKGDFWWASHIQLPQYHQRNPWGMHTQTCTRHQTRCLRIYQHVRLPLQEGSHHREGWSQIFPFCLCCIGCFGIHEYYQHVLIETYEINMDSNMENTTQVTPLWRALLMFSEMLLLHSHRFISSGKANSGLLICSD